jgi:mono/diheme cytochrome c family protein
LKFVFLAPAAAGVALAAALGTHAAAGAAGASVAFSAMQATQGAKFYTQNCASCHGADLKGISAPALVGSTSSIATQSIAEVYAYISQQMPMTAPGSLSEAQYTSILAYLLQRNGHKAGPHPLTTAIAKNGTAMIAGHS